MPWEPLAIYLSYVLFAIGGWLLKTLFAMVQELQKEIKDLQHRIEDNHLQVTKEYMPRDEVRVMFEDILREQRAMRQDLKEHEQREFTVYRPLIDKASRE